MKKKTIKRIIASALSAIIMTQVIPISASAIQNLKRTEIGESSLKESVPNIVKEVKDERGEFNKVYLLEDGSYCNISTFAPIHENVKGKWENIDNSIDEDVKTVEEAKTKLQSVSTERYTNMETRKNSAVKRIKKESTNSSLVFNVIDGIYNNGVLTIDEWGAFVIKQTYIENYITRNRLITDASIKANYNCTSVTNNCEILAYKMDRTWNENSDLSDFNVEDSGIPIDSVTINETGEGVLSWNITDLYSKWDKDVELNNGVVFGAKGDTCDISLYSICISVIYRDVDESDSFSTYHNVDMGKAGIIYINDLTNAVKLEQEIFTVQRKVLPIHLKRIYNVTDSFEPNGDGGFRWNYESKIHLRDGLVAWKTFDGSVKYFVRSGSGVESNGYTKWLPVSVGSAEDTVLWIKSSELLNVEYDYSNFNIVSNNIIYRFNSQGNLISMNIENDMNYEIKFIYADNELTKISYLNDNVRSTINLDKTNGNYDVNILSHDKATHQDIHTDFVVINSEVEGDNTIVTVIYRDGKTVKYIINELNQLVEVLDESGNSVELSYIDICRLSFYNKSLASGDIENVEFENENTYRRQYSYGEAQEVIQYDRNFRIISHKDITGKYTFASYDENGMVNSYVVSSEQNEEMLTNGNFEANKLKPWKSINNGAGSKLKVYSNSPLAIGKETDSIADVTPPDNGSDRCASIISSDNIGSCTLKNSVHLDAEQTYVFGVFIINHLHLVISKTLSLKMKIHIEDNTHMAKLKK